MTPNRTLTEWRIVFYVICAVLIIVNIFYLIFASGEKQPWNDVEPEKEVKEEPKLQTWTSWFRTTLSKGKL